MPWRFRRDAPTTAGKPTPSCADCPLAEETAAVCCNLIRISVSPTMRGAHLKAHEPHGEEQHMSRRNSLGTIVALILLGTFALAGIRGTFAATPATPGASVTIQNFAFSPAVLKVALGATVTWTNKDSVAHTVTSDTNAWTDSGPL